MKGGEVILYDGACGLCHRLVRFVLARDRAGRFRFAPLQGALAGEICARHGKRATDLNTFYLVTDWSQPEEAIHARAAGILRVLDGLGGPWRAFTLLRAVPSPILDLAYGLVARTRYRVFGRSETCAVSAPEHRGRFL